MKKYFAVLPLSLPFAANAASVLDAATKTAMESGFTDVKDTFVDVITTAFPVLLAVIAITLAPRIVKRIASMF